MPPRDARLRSDTWFSDFETMLKTLKGDAELAIAASSIDQIAKIAETSKIAFLEGAQRTGIEIFREKLTEPATWVTCTSLWGFGPGFKGRVADILEKWFNEQSELETKLESLLTNLWQRTVVLPLMRFVEEGSPDPDGRSPNVIHLPSRRARPFSR